MLNLDKSLRDLRRQLECVNRAITTMESISLDPTPKRRRGRKSMGHEERLVVSERMKRYWAERRRAKEERKASGRGSYQPSSEDRVEGARTSKQLRETPPTG